MFDSKVFPIKYCLFFQKKKKLGTRWNHQSPDRKLKKKKINSQEGIFMIGVGLERPVNFDEENHISAGGRIQNKMN